MESDDDPLLVKFLISSLEFEKLKYFETKCSELSAELEKLKLHNSEQLGGGNYVVESNSTDSLKTATLKEVNDGQKPLINYSVPLSKNIDYDHYDESALLHLVPQKDQFSANFLLQKIDDRGSELTWNSSGTVFIDKVSIPNSNMFYIYPYLFKKSMPKLKIAGLKEVVKKLEIMGLSQFIALNNKEFHNTNSINIMEGSGAAGGAGVFQSSQGQMNEPAAILKSIEPAIETNDNGSKLMKENKEKDVTTAWWYINE